MAVPKKKVGVGSGGGASGKVAAKAKSPARPRSTAKLTSPEKSYKGPRDPRMSPEVVVVDEIPPAYASRTTRYAKKLADIREKVEEGQTAIVAEFIGRSGATVVKKALENNERAVDGDVDDWKFTARRLDGGGSVLYATLVKK